PPTSTLFPYTTLFRSVLWRDPAERAVVRTAIRELLRGYEDEVQVLLYQSRELREYALRAWDTHELRTRAALEAHTKIRNILGKVDRKSTRLNSSHVAI